MTRTLANFFVVFALLCCELVAQGPAKAPVDAGKGDAAPGQMGKDQAGKDRASKDQTFKDQALVFERYETTYRMHADGTGERDMRALLRVQSEGAARQFAVLSFAYASANETPHLKVVRVHKADGSVVDTPVADAIEMPAAVSREAPLYSDLKEKHIPVRSLSVGDTLEYEVETTIDKAEAPGEFWGAHHFVVPGTTVTLMEVLTVEFPKDTYAQVWSPKHKPVESERDGVKSYRWEVAQLTPAPSGNVADDSGKAGAEKEKAGDGKTAGDKNSEKAKGVEESAAATPKDPDEDGDGRKLPSVAWTTFHTWAQVGDWYRGLALTQAQPNDALRARAEEITKEAKTPEEQVKAIYAFVAGRTRYVGIDFGVGRYKPHLAAEVLANQYGDCKDKDTLLEALLRAKGFKTAPALIGAGIAPTEEVPSPASFNHVITTVMLPGGEIWLDSTPEVAPYRYLSAGLRDEAALVVPAEGAAGLQRTPAEPPYPLEARYESVGSLDTEGKFTSKVTARYRTDDEVFVRALARSVAPAEWDKASQYIAAITGFSGTTSDTHFGAVEDLTKPIEIDYEYSRHPYGDWDNLRIIPPFPMLDFGLLASDSHAPETDIELGAPRTLIAAAHVRLPEGFRPDLPDPIHVKTDFLTFDKTYRFDGKEVVIERTTVVLKKKLPKAEWKRFATFTKEASLANEPWIQLIRPMVAEKTTVISLHPETDGDKSEGKASSPKAKAAEVKPVVPAGADKDAAGASSPQEMMGEAWKRMMAGDYAGSVTILDGVKEKNPKQDSLWEMYGYIAAQQGKMDEAKEDYRRELVEHPDNENAVTWVAEMLTRTGHPGEAASIVEPYAKRHPDDSKIWIYLAGLQTKSSDEDRALKTLEKAAAANPESGEVQVELSRALLKMDRRDEAAAAAKSALDGLGADSEDARLMNAAADAMADVGLNLGEAEAASRKSIGLLEAKSAAITTAEVNSKAFADANLLIASWDTLGWILFQEGKVADAKPWIEASWRNNLNSEVGDHLGQVYEAGEQKDAALRAYSEAAVTTEHGSRDADVKKRLAEAIARMKKAGAKPDTTPAFEALQAMRAFKIAGPVGVTGWGTFRLQVTPAGVIGAQQMSGEAKLASVAEAIDGMTLTQLLPAGSKAHLLRSAVVSCSSKAMCDLVLVPNGNMQTERY